MKIANAPCSWGVIEGIDGAHAGFVRVVDEMAETGYSGTELGDWGFMPTDPERLRDELGSRGLVLAGSWVSVRLQDVTGHERSAADAVRTADLLARVGGPENVIVLGNDPYGDPVRTRHAGRITPKLGMSADQWKVFAAGANAVARRVHEAHPGAPQLLPGRPDHSGRCLVAEVHGDQPTARALPAPRDELS